MAGHLQPSDTGALADLFISIFRKDAAATVNAALLLSISGAPENRDMLEQEVAEFIAFEAEAIINSGHVSKGLERAVEILRHHNIQLTPRFAMLIKALATIEVVGRTLNPKMDVVPLMQPFLEKLISERYQPLHVMREMTHNTSTLIKLTRQLPADLSLLLHQLNQGRLNIRYKNEDQDRMINAIDLAGSRIAMGLSLAGVLVASSMLFEHGPPLSRIGAIGYIVAIGIGAYLGMSILWRKP
jgi:ubiquinone biosynthesis protein